MTVRYREISIRCHGLKWHKWRTYDGIMSGLLRCQRCGVIRRHRPASKAPPMPSRRDTDDLSATVFSSNS